MKIFKIAYSYVPLLFLIGLCCNLNVAGNSIRSDIRGINRILNELPVAEDVRCNLKYSIKSKNGGKHLTVISDTYDRLGKESKISSSIFFLESLYPDFGECRRLADLNIFAGSLIFYHDFC